MEKNNIFGGGFGYETRMQMNSGVVQADKHINMTKEAASGSTSTASEDVSRRRKPEAEKDRSSLKKKKESERPPEFIPPPLPPYIPNQGRIKFLFFKQLQNSDVNSVGRTILPKKPAEVYLPVLSENGSIILRMDDINCAQTWSFKYRYWLNNQSRMYVLEGTGDFTKMYCLQKGDYILLYRDLLNLTYMIRAVRASDVEGCSDQLTALVGNNALAHDADVQNSPAPGGLNPSHYPNNFPSMEDKLDMTSRDDNNYFSDVLNQFSLWDELINNYPATRPSVSFDNLSSEDLAQV